MKEIELNNIKNIIFDLGGVLLNLDMEGSIKAFQSLGFNLNIITKDQIFSHKFFGRFQNGELTVEEFYIHLRDALNNPSVTDEELQAAWNKMVLDIPFYRVEILQKLKKKYKIYLFSNTNSIHVKKVEKEFFEAYGFSFQSLFTEVYYSHEIFHSKPMVSSYLKVVKDAGIIANESLFVDDLEKNISGAQMAGLNCFWLQPEMDITQVFGKTFIPI